MIFFGYTDINSPRPYRSSWLAKTILLLIFFGGIGALLHYFLDEPLPSGSKGMEADLLARKVMMSVYHDNWERTGAIQWNFDDRRQHLWDRNRNLARVEWDSYEVLINLSDQRGIAFQDKKRMGYNDTRDILKKAWEYWVNDSFWLNPVSKFYDKGVVRKKVVSDGQTGLLVTFNQGGTSPGDSYLWLLDGDGLPSGWKMWVKDIPLGGVEVSWENWITLSTGVRIATLHQTPLFDIYIKGVEGAETIGELVPGEDPFAPLVAVIEK